MNVLSFQMPLNSIAVCYVLLICILIYLLRLPAVVSCEPRNFTFISYLRKHCELADEIDVNDNAADVVNYLMILVFLLLQVAVLDSIFGG